MNESGPTMPGGMSINEALMQIHGIEQQVMAQGGNDSEMELFRNLKKDVAESVIAPLEGVRRAQGIMDAKNSNYH